MLDVCDGPGLCKWRYGVCVFRINVFLPDAPGMTPDLLRKFSEAAGSHTKKHLGFI